MFCNKCGKEISDDSIVCNYCGTPTNSSANSQSANIGGQQPQIVIMNQNNQQQNGYISAVSDKNWLTALLLCIFLGFLGIHRFYVGKGGTGVIWLFTAGVFGLGWIIDIVILITGGFTDSLRRPLHK